ERFRKVDGGWRIAGWRLTYLRIDPLPRAPMHGPAVGGPEDAANMVRVGEHYRRFHAGPGAAAPGDEQELADREAIRELKARYYRAADTQEWGAFRRLFADDVRVDLLPGHQFEGADTYVEAVRGMTAGATTVHQAHMPQL